MKNRDLIKQLLEFPMDREVAFDATELVDVAGENGGWPSIDITKTGIIYTDEVILLRSLEV